VKQLSILIKKIEQRLKKNTRRVSLLDMVLMIFVIAYGIIKMKKIIRSRDIIFNEKVIYKDQLQGKKHEKEKPEYTMLDEITQKEIPKVPKNQNVQKQE
jgi:hypothetical protein